MQLPPIAATTVGSFPRPSWLAAVDRSDATFRLEGPALREAQDDATIVVLEEQEALGLDLLTDGEQRRPNFINHFLGGLEGFDLTHRVPKAIRRRDSVLRDVPRVVGQVRRPGPVLAEDLRVARAHTSLPVKMA